MPRAYTANELRDHLKGKLPLAFGVSGPLATPLFSARETRQLVQIAREHGILIFDTGPSYGAGEAERRLGAALKDDPDAIIMTKAGVSASGVVKRTRNLRPQAIVQSVEESLNRLQREKIDVLWLHGPHPSELNDELYTALENLAKAGKVAAFGITLRQEQLLEKLGDEPIACYMAPSNRDNVNLKHPCEGPLRFGIETLAASTTLGTVPTRRSDIWRYAKRVVRGGENLDQSQISVAEAFQYAFEIARCDFIVTTTTRPDRIKENCALCRRLVAK